MSLFIRSSRRLLTNVSLIGAAGGIGQPLALLLKQTPGIKQLNLFDLANTAGIAADLSHICTPAVVKGFGVGDLSKALEGAQIVVIPAGVPRKPGMTRDDLFNVNAGVVRDVIANAAKVCPKAAFLIITNPVNSTVPIASVVLKKAGVYNPKKLFGVTSLDLVRAKAFVHALKGVDFDVPVIGGHSGPTIVPLLSKVPGVQWTPEELEALTKRIQYAGDEVVQAKAGAGSATLSMAYAGARLTAALIRAAAGEKVQDYAFVDNEVAGLPFFATKVTFAKDFAWEKADPIPEMSAFEKTKYAECVEQLAKDIKKGIEWASQ